MAVFNPRHKHDSLFYVKLIQRLVAGLHAGFTHPELRDSLNTAEIPSPTNVQWTTTSVTAMMARLRAGSGHIYVAALKMYMNGLLGLRDIKTLTSTI